MPPCLALRGRKHLRRLGHASRDAQRYAGCRARPEGQKFGASLNFGFAEFRDRFRRTKEIALRNHGSSDAIFKVAQAAASGSPHTVSLSRTSVRVPAHGETEISVTLDVPAATAGGSEPFRGGGGFCATR